MIKLLSILICVCLLVGTSPAQDQQNLEQLYTRKAVKAFVSKDFNASIENVKQVLRINPNNNQAKKLLAKGYYFQSKQLFAAKEYSLCDAMLDELFVISPKHQLGLSLRAKVKPLLIVQPTMQATQEQRGRSPQQIQQIPSQIIVKTDDGGKSEKMISAFLAQSDMQREIQARKDSLSRLQNIELINLMKDRDAESSTKFNKTFIWVAIIIIGTIFIIIAVVFLLAKMFIKTSELQSAQQYEVLQNLLSQGPVMNESTLKLTATSGSTEADLDNDDDLKRANAVEAIAEDLAGSESVSDEHKEKIEKVRLLLSDSNNRVRANAAKVIYAIDSEASLNCLKEMVFSTSKRQSASGIWALGEIHSKETLSIILDKVAENDDDEIITHNLLNALKKVESDAGEELDEDDRLTIVKTLEVLQSKENG
ncbi:MAG: HEAT repeat domain-containing protein [Fibrobacterales bacterium]